MEMYEHYEYPPGVCSDDEQYYLMQEKQYYANNSRTSNLF